MPEMRLILPTLVAACVVAQTPEWPQFRGVDGSGSAASPAPVEFGPGKNVVWKAHVPVGHSSPVIAGNRIFITGEEGGRKANADRDKITTDGVLYCWGSNLQGQLGARTTAACGTAPNDTPCSVRPLRVVGQS